MNLGGTGQMLLAGLMLLAVLLVPRLVGCRARPLIAPGMVLLPILVGAIVALNVGNGLARFDSLELLPRVVGLATVRVLAGQVGALAATARAVLLLDEGAWTEQADASCGRATSFGRRVAVAVGFADVGLRAAMI